jgi:hypothetical protein
VHDVVALVRDPMRAELPPGVTIVIGDASRFEDVVRRDDRRERDDVLR